MRVTRTKRAILNVLAYQTEESGFEPPLVYAVVRSRVKELRKENAEMKSRD